MNISIISLFLDGLFPITDWDVAFTDVVFGYIIEETWSHSLPNCNILLIQVATSWTIDTLGSHCNNVLTSNF